jgi:hypothetical protein
MTERVHEIAFWLMLIVPAIGILHYLSVRTGGKKA